MWPKPAQLPPHSVLPLGQNLLFSVSRRSPLQLQAADQPWLFLKVRPTLNSQVVLRTPPNSTAASPGLQATVWTHILIPFHVKQNVRDSFPSLVFLPLEVTIYHFLPNILRVRTGAPFRQDHLLLIPLPRGVGCFERACCCADTRRVVCR